MEQKTAVEKLEIPKYGAKRALDRPEQGSSDEALWGAARAGAVAKSKFQHADWQHMSCG